MTVEFRFPPRNLPGLADDWGRAVERLIESGGRELTQTVQKSGNGLRASSGQFAVLSNQVEELSQRGLEVAYGDDVSVGAGGASRTITFNPSPQSVLSYLTVSFFVSDSAPGAFVPAITAQVSYQGSTILEKVVSGFDNRTREPTEFRNNVPATAATYIQTMAGDSPSIVLQFTGNSGHTYTITGITATLTRAGVR